MISHNSLWHLFRENREPFSSYMIPCTRFKDCEVISCRQKLHPTHRTFTIINEIWDKINIRCAKITIPLDHFRFFANIITSRKLQVKNLTTDLDRCCSNTGWTQVNEGFSYFKNDVWNIIPDSAFLVFGIRIIQIKWVHQSRSGNLKNKFRKREMFALHR